MRERLVPLTLFGSLVAIALFLFVIGYIRWIARDLASSQEHAQNLLGRDPLSGLPNRLLFAERLDQELTRSSAPAAGSRCCSSTSTASRTSTTPIGHQAGDELIKLVARRLEELLRGTDTLARFGGDEFAIIQTGLRAPRDADALARRILDERHPALRDRRRAGQRSASRSASRSRRTTARAREDLMRLADTALYQAKSEGRNRYRFFAAADGRDHPHAQDRRGRPAPGHRPATSSACITSRSVSADGQTIVGARGAGALAACEAGPHQPGAVHLHRRGARPRHPARRMGAAPRLPRRPALAGPAHRRERIADPVPAPRLRRERHAGPEGDRLRGQPARDRAHRGRRRRGCRRGRGRHDGAARPRREPRARRFRHRLFVA